MKAKRPMSSKKIAVIITTGRNPVYCEILKLDMLQNSPMLDNRGEETEDSQGDKTQSENQGGVKVFRASAHVQLLPEYPGI